MAESGEEEEAGPPPFRIMGGVAAGDDNGPVLRVSVKFATRLRKADIFGMTHAYVTAQLMESPPMSGRDNLVIGEVVKSSTIHHTLNPVWNDDLGLRWNKVHPRSRDPPELYVVICIFDKNRLTKDTFLGQVVIDLRDLPVRGNETWRSRYFVPSRCIHYLLSIFVSFSYSLIVANLPLFCSSVMLAPSPSPFPPPRIP